MGLFTVSLSLLFTVATTLVLSWGGLIPAAGFAVRFFSYVLPLRFYFKVKA